MYTKQNCVSFESPVRLSFEFVSIVAGVKSVYSQKQSKKKLASSATFELALMKLREGDDRDRCPRHL